MKFLIKTVLPAISAIYLSLAIGIQSNASRKQYLILAIFFFLVIKYFLDNFYEKFQQAKKPGRLQLLIACVLAALLLFSADKYLVPAYKTQKEAVFSITALNEKNDSSVASEVWILGINNGETDYDLGKLRLDSAWERRDTRILSYQHHPASLNIIIENADNPSIKLLKHDWSGKVKITDGKNVTIVDLFKSGERSEYIYKVKNLVNIATRSGITTEMLYYLLTLVFLFSIIYPLVVINRGNLKYYFLVNLLLWIMLFVFPGNLTLSAGEIVWLLLLSVLSGKLVTRAFKPGGPLYQRLSRREIIVLLLITLYASFACIGNALFLTGEDPLTWAQVCYFIVFACWFFSIEIAFLYVTYSLQETYNRSALTNAALVNKGSGIQLWGLVFLILTTIWLICLFAFYPGIMSSDSLDQWGQATGVFPLNDWHPVFHTLFNRIFLLVSRNPAIIATGQIFLLAAVAATFILFLYKKGVSKNWLLFFTLIFALFPANGIMVITLWKDIPFTISLLWLTYLLARISTDINYLKNNRLALAGLTLALVAVALFRHNGIVVYILVFLVLSFYSFRYKTRWTLLSLAASLVLIIGFKVFVSGNKRVIPVPSEVKLIAPVNGLAAAMKENALTTDVQKKMETILNREDWIRLYSPYWANAYQFNTNGAYMKNLSAYSTGDILKMYASTMYRHPYFIIKDRLQGTDILWDVSRPALAYNFYYSTELEANNYGLTQKKNNLKPVISKYLKTSETIGADFFWRAGIYNILIFLLMFFVAKTKSKRNLLSFLPWLGAVLSLLPSLVWQEFRYIYFVQVLFGFLWLFSIPGNVERKDNI